jgi:hypothetical protein
MRDLITHPAIRRGLTILAIVALLATVLYALGAPEQPRRSDSVTPAAKVTRMIEDPARAPYGSGPHGGWTTKTPSISTDARFAEMVASNGVLLIGDSIARQAASELAQRIWDDHHIYTAVNNWPSRPTAPAVDWLEDHQEYIPDRGIVMATGANDIFNPYKWWQQVNRVLEIADGRPVYWVSVYVDRWSVSDPWQRAADMRNSAWINQQLYATANAYPNLHVIDWFASLNQGYNESRVADLLSDGVHLTPAGVTAWGDLVTLRMGL